MEVPSRNRLLRAMSAPDRESLRAALEPVTLELRMVLEAPGQAISQVYFVESGMVSIVANSPPDRRIEVGLAGHEGMTGVPVILGDDRSSRESMVQGAGTALRLPADTLRQLMAARPTLQRVLLRYAHAFMEQTSQTALSNGRAILEERLARWLLMAQDRIGRNGLTVTHEFLAVMLGMRRPGVTVALHLLEGRGLIRSQRGHIEIVNRPGLVELADGSYGSSEAAYERLFGGAA